MAALRRDSARLLTLPMLYWKSQGDLMPVRRSSATAAYIQDLADQFHIVYRATATDDLAHQITRLSGDDVDLDPVEQMLIGLQRAGHIDRRKMIELQARYLREITP
jgi:hypothetical protein